MRAPFVKSYVLLVLALVSAHLDAAFAASVTIDFETLPNGDVPPFSQEVDTAYESLGVTFGSLDPNDLMDPIFVIWSRDPQGNYTRGVADQGRDPLGTIGFHILATFTSPVVDVSFDWQGPTASGHSVVVAAFGPQGQPLVTTNVGMGYGRASIAGVGPISAVTWQTTYPIDSGPTIDNLAFTPVPEPGAGILVGLGLVALSMRRRALAASRRPTHT